MINGVSQLYRSDSISLPSIGSMLEAFAGSLVKANDAAVLAFGINDIRICRVDVRRESVPAGRLHTNRNL